MVIGMAAGMVVPGQGPGQGDGDNNACWFLKALPVAGGLWGEIIPSCSEMECYRISGSENKSNCCISLCI